MASSSSTSTWACITVKRSDPHGDADADTDADADADNWVAGGCVAEPAV